jgi:hypothetical protein
VSSTSEAAAATPSPPETTTEARSAAATTSGVSVNIDFKVENVVFNDMTEDHKTELKQDIQNIIAEQTGVQMGSVIVTLSAGSVVVNVEVTPTESITVAMITNAVASDKSKIAENVIDEMEKMPGFAGSPTIDVSTFTATVNTPLHDHSRTTTAAPSDADVADMASQRSLNPSVSVVATAFFLCGIHK